MTVPVLPYSKKKLREWTPQQKREYYDAYRRHNDRAMAAMTPDVESDTANERYIARNNLRFWIGEELNGTTAATMPNSGQQFQLAGERYGNNAKYDTT